MKDSNKCAGMNSNHPPLPTNQSIKNTHVAVNNNRHTASKTKRTDNSAGSACNNSMETTERSSTGTTRSSPTDSKNSRHMMIDEHAGRFITSSGNIPTGPNGTAGSSCSSSGGLTPPKPSVFIATNINGKSETNSTAPERGRIVYLQDDACCLVKTTILPNSQGQPGSMATMEGFLASNGNTAISSNNGADHVQFNQQQRKQTVLTQKQLKPPLMDNRSTASGNLNATGNGGMSGIGGVFGKPPQNQTSTRKNNVNNSVMINENKAALMEVTTTNNNFGTTAEYRAIDLADKEQALFEQRLCDENYGVAVRKINQYGKPNLRFVKCIIVDDAASTRKSGNHSLSSHNSASSWGRNSSSLHNSYSLKPMKERSTLSSTPSFSSSVDQNNIQSNVRRVLTWGKKKDVQVDLNSFLCVRKGKTTERAKRNAASANRILSLITKDPLQLSLDIEAPTQMDRDKFAKAFARFLDVPLEGDNPSVATFSGDSAQLQLSVTSPGSNIKEQETSTQQLASSDLYNNLKSKDDVGIRADGNISDPSAEFHDTDNKLMSQPVTTAEVSNVIPTEGIVVNSNAPINEKVKQVEELQTTALITIPNSQTVIVRDAEETNGEEGSHISSLTGNGFDHELVEELHNALNELRVELEESRAEAARAVKVAEQAIQSAEKSNSVEWQNTVTHKAAEAAARAQKQSATALAKARLAEERLEAEKRAAHFWKKQAEVAEVEAGALQTRVAAAEVQRAAMEEQLKTERRIFNAQLHCSKDRLARNDSSQRQALDEALDRTRALELELDSTRRDLVTRNECIDLEPDTAPSAGIRKKRTFLPRKKNTSGTNDQDSRHLLLAASLSSSSSSQVHESRDIVTDRAEVSMSDQLLQLHAETKQFRREFEMFRRASVDDIHQLPNHAKAWSNQIRSIVKISRSEVIRLQEQLAMECASRRKLLHEVQDLRGTVRVYCRPHPVDCKDQSQQQLFSFPSHDTLVLNLDQCPSDHESPVGQSSFEFDRVFPPTANQQDVYTEVQDVCLSVLDGYNICVMSHGSAGSGKTHTILGDINISASTSAVKIQNPGIHLLLMQQLFTIAKHRRKRYKDSFSISIVEVYDEKLCDLMVGTKLGDLRGDPVAAEGRIRRQKSDDDNSNPSKPQTKLEIRSNINGETVVQGLLSVVVESYDEVLQIWEECLTGMQQRLMEQGIDRQQYHASSHIIVTLKVESQNIATGSGCIGKIQFVDLASVDVTRRRKGSDGKASVMDEATSAVISSNVQRDWRFSNKSLETLQEVVEAKVQFEKSVPYRNSTLTHLLQDSLDGDTKVLLFSCLKSNPCDLHIIVPALRFVSRMRRLVVGKATRHTFATSSSQIQEC